MLTGLTLFMLMGLTLFMLMGLTLFMLMGLTLFMLMGTLQPEALQRALDADPWRVAEAERQGDQVAPPPGVALLPEYELVVEAEPEDEGNEATRAAARWGGVGGVCPGGCAAVHACGSGGWWSRSR